MEAQNRAAQGYGRNIMGIYTARSLYSLYIPTIVLGFPVLAFPFQSLYASYYYIYGLGFRDV